MASAATGRLQRGATAEIAMISAADGRRMPGREARLRRSEREGFEMKDAEKLEIPRPHAADEMLQDGRRERGHGDRRKHEEGALRAKNETRPLFPGGRGKAHAREDQAHDGDRNHPDPSLPQNGDVLEEARHGSGQVPHGRRDRPVERERDHKHEKHRSRHGACAGQESQRRRCGGPDQKGEALRQATRQATRQAKRDGARGSLCPPLGRYQRIRRGFLPCRLNRHWRRPRCPCGARRSD